MAKSNHPVCSYVFYLSAALSTPKQRSRAEVILSPVSPWHRLCAVHFKTDFYCWWGSEYAFDPGCSQGRCLVSHRVSNAHQVNMSGFAISVFLGFFFEPHRAFLPLVMKIKEKKKAKPQFFNTVNWRLTKDEASARSANPPLSTASPTYPLNTSQDVSLNDTVSASPWRAEPCLQPDNFITSLPPAHFHSSFGAWGIQGDG